LPWRVRRQIHDRLQARVSSELVQPSKAREGSGRSFAQLLRRPREPAALSMAQEGLDPSGRSARLVPMVLPLLHGPPHPRGGRPADQALEGDPASRPTGRAKLRARRFDLPQAPAPGAAALGLRQPEDLIAAGAIRSPRRQWQEASAVSPLLSRT